MFIKGASDMSNREQESGARMNLAGANLIRVLPEKPFVMLGSRRDSAESGVLGGGGESGGGRGKG